MMAHASECPGESRASDVLMLSRIAVSERSFVLGHDDHPAIHWVIRDVQRRFIRRENRCVSYTEAARIHSPRATGARQTTGGRQRWVSKLGWHGHRPVHFPRHLNWRKHRIRFGQILEHSQDIYDGKIQDRCRQRPHYWGGNHPNDKRRAACALAEGRWEIVDCGQTKNTFYRRTGKRIVPSHPRPDVCRD